MANTLILYSTVDGHTRKICGHLAQTLAAEGEAVQICPLDESDDAMLNAADRVIIGASIRYGHHRPSVRAFIDRHQALLRGQAERLLLGEHRRAQARETYRRDESLRRQVPALDPLAAAPGRRLRRTPRLPELPSVRPLHDSPDHAHHQRPDRPEHGNRDTDWAEVEAFAQTLRAMTGPASDCPTCGKTIQNGRQTAEPAHQEP